MSARKNYLQQLWKRWSLLGVWEPDSQVAVGEVGVMEDWRFRGLRHLEVLAVDFETVSSDARAARLYQSSTGVTVAATGEAAAGTGAGPSTEGGVRVAFDNGGGVVFHAEGTYEIRLRDVGTVQDAIWRLHMEGKWRREEVLITKVIAAESLVVLIADSDGATVELTAGAAAIPEMPNLADVRLGVQVARHAGMLTAITARGRLTPLYEGICVDRGGLLRRRAVRVATPEGGRLEPDDVALDEGENFSRWHYSFEEALRDNEHN